MFIEGLRRAKNKWRIVVGVLMGLIIISLLLTFANFGNKVDTSGIATDTSLLGTAKTTAENAEASAKAADGDMTVQGEAASAYLSLAAYQQLYLEDATSSYEKALTYAQAMLEACGSAEDPDYDTAYQYEMTALKGLGDAEGLSQAFNESLAHIELSQSLLATYAEDMTALGATDQLIADLTAAKAQLPTSPTADADAEEDDAASDSGEDLTTYIDTLIAQAEAN